MHEDMCLCHDFQDTGTQNFNLLNVTLVNDSAAAVKIYFEKKKKRRKKNSDYCCASELIVFKDRLFIHVECHLVFNKQSGQLQCYM